MDRADDGEMNVRSVADWLKDRKRSADLYSLLGIIIQIVADVVRCITYI